jgi:L-histidine Nalpha-methyltransferase / hercynylcysteine S-oxide synthase
MGTADDDSHLVNDGVEETPPSHHGVPVANGSAPVPKTHFVDLVGCNVGFKSWTPTPVTGDGMRLRGQGDAGGLWEWTSTPLAAYEGYKPMDLYPGYSADFFDGKHNICLGGSWATVPRIAGRRSFVGPSQCWECCTNRGQVNWYQHNYPYVWCTARLVRDIA